MLRGSENCYSMLMAALSGSGLNHKGLSGSDAAALADLRATNEAVALQRTMEDRPESISDCESLAPSVSQRESNSASCSAMSTNPQSCLKVSAVAPIQHSISSGTGEVQDAGVLIRKRKRQDNA